MRYINLWFTYLLTYFKLTANWDRGSDRLLGYCQTYSQLGSWQWQATGLLSFGHTVHCCIHSCQCHCGRCTDGAWSLMISSGRRRWFGRAECKADAEWVKWYMLMETEETRQRGCLYKTDLVGLCQRAYGEFWPVLWGGLGCGSMEAENRGDHLTRVYLENGH